MNQATPAPDPGKSTNRWSALPWRKKLLFALFPLCLLIATCEFTLRGIGFQYNPHDLNGRLFESDGSGSLRTSWLFTDPKNVHAFNFPAPVTLCRRQHFAREKRSEVLRIAILGGSSVWLLDQADGLRARLEKNLQRPVEVINMGVMGCGSGRVLRSAREAINFDVDIFMVYTGHNEFHDFANPVIYKKVPFGLRQPVRSLRTIQMIWWIVDRFRPSDPSSNGGRGDVLAAVSNQRLLSTEEREVIYEQYRRNLDELAELAEQHDVFVVVGTVASNLNAPPEHPELRRQVMETLELPADEIRRLATAPDADWAACFCHGLNLKYEGKAELAREYLEKALLLSPEPGRANRRINDILKQTSIDHRIPLADVESRVSASDPNNLPDDFYFRDAMHMKPPGNAILLDAYYEAISNHLDP